MSHKPKRETNWMNVSDYYYCAGYRGRRMTRLAILKGIVYALIMGTVSIVGIMEQGDPTYIVLAFIFGALLIFGVEINTVELGSWLEIDFSEDGSGSASNDSTDTTEDTPDDE